jgi:hypothetical protein
LEFGIEEGDEVSGATDEVIVGFVLLWFVGTAVGRLVGTAPVKNIPFPWNNFPLGEIADSLRL